MHPILSRCRLVLTVWTLFLGAAITLMAVMPAAQAGSGSSRNQDDEAPEIDDDAFEHDRDDRDRDGRDRDDREKRDRDDRDNRDRQDSDRDDRDRDKRDRGDTKDDERGSDGRSGTERDDKRGGDREGRSSTEGQTTGKDQDRIKDAAIAPAVAQDNRGITFSGIDRAEHQLEDIDSKRDERFLRGELILVSASKATPGKLLESGFRVIEAFALPGFGLHGYRVAYAAGLDREAALDKLRRVDPEGIASLNHVYTPARGGATIAEKPALKASPPRRTKESARIGLVDAPVNAQHPMLSAVRVEARAFGLATPDVDGHGTAVASRLAEAAPGAHLYVASVFSKLQGGEEIASVDAIARALDWLARNRIAVINLSLAGPPNPILQAVTGRLVERGHTLVAAVGNEGPHGQAQFPAAYDGVVGVTAVDQRNEVYIYANRGDYVDFAARGVGARVAGRDGISETVSGTSYAAPIVAAELARRLPVPDRARADLVKRDLARAARDLGEPGRDPVYGFGVIELSPD